MTSAISKALVLYDDATRERLQRCVPMAEAALDNWCSGPLIDASPEIILVAATPLSAVVMRGDAWLELDETLAASIDKDGIVVAMAHAIESAPTKQSTQIILTGLCALLGNAAVKQKMELSAQIKAAGNFPLHVLLIEKDGDEIASVALTVALAVGDGATRH